MAKFMIWLRRPSEGAERKGLGPALSCFPLKGAPVSHPPAPQGLCGAAVLAP